MTSITRQTGGSRTPIPGGTRVSHSELFEDVPSHAAFNTLTIQVNPGLNSFSAWLAAQAADYDQYRLVSLVAEYKPTCGTGTAGSVYMVYDYDPSDAPPGSKQAMSQYQGSAESAPWVKFSMACDAKAVHAIGPRKFLRSGPVAGDLRTYDSAQFILATSGFAAPDGVLVGELWFHYTFDLLVQTSPISAQITQVYEFGSNTLQNVGSGLLIQETFQVVVSNFQGQVVQGPTQQTFIMPTCNMWIICNGVIQLNALSSSTFYVNYQFFINGVGRASGTVSFQSAEPAGALRSFILQGATSFKAGDVLQLTITNTGATNAVAVVPGCSISFLSI
jgi:hypothetical protein